MFMPSAFAGTSIHNIDPESERDPPKDATPVTFPTRPVPPTRPWSDALPPPNLRGLYSRIMKLSDICDDHLEALNIQVLPDCSPEDLIPKVPDGKSYFPALSSDSTPIINGGTSYADATKADPATAKKRAEFEERLAELRIDNDTAFRIITRSTKPGVNKPKLAYLRKFWEGLESMSEYWDTSLDQIYEGVPSSAAGGSDGKRQRLDSVHGEENGKENGKENDSFEATNQTPSLDITPPPEACPTPTQPTTNTCLLYKGRRISTGRDMPDSFRSDTLKTFLEAVTWPFNCNVTAPRRLPILQMNHLNVPVRQTAAVYRVPTERRKARAGFIEGPIMGLQARPETEFDAVGMEDRQRNGKARLDAMREVGGLLQLAQERSRKGKMEKKPGEGHWWTEKPRWGGGKGGEVEAEGLNAESKDVLMVDGDGIAAPPPPPIAKLPPSRRRKTPAMLWSELKCGSSLWDAKTEYEAIGKDPDSEWDEIFQVSSLNHHVSILKLTVHNAYTEYITTGQMPMSPPQSATDENGEERQWHTPKLQRTRWYDLFNVDDRVEAFRALWGVMEWLTRYPQGSNASPS
ncbi:unnamed protein product [Zymoseptoria tritici ST99CH_1A5]|nr:unnamed protein product [Zymoseptoria tritici ST99CH_1A5]